MINHFWEHARRNAFWMIDGLKGGKIKQAYKEVKFINEQANSEEAKEINRQNLTNLLNHAVSTTPFYNAFEDFHHLGDFPVINKVHLKTETSQFLSSKYKGENLYRQTTSGSTGTPLTVFQDKVKRIRHIAENIYFSDIIGYNLGSRLYYLRVWNELNRKSPLKSWMQNMVMQNAANISDNSWEKFLYKIKKDNSNKSILGYGLTLEALGRYLSKNNIILKQGKVNSVISIAETLPNHTKELLKTAFQCPVISRYSNMENGFLAQQNTGECNEFHLNLASYYFELLHPEKDKPVKPGETGRIVVTDLFNFAMPLIRYDTGDMAIMAEKPACGATGLVFSKILGKRCDCVFDTSGNLLSTGVVINTMWIYSDEINQFQFIQNGQNQYLLKLNCSNTPFTREKKLLSNLKFYLGKDAKITIEYVDEIPVLSSGKRKQMVNNYKPA